MTAAPSTAAIAAVVAPATGNTANAASMSRLPARWGWKIERALRNGSHVGERPAVASAVLACSAPSRSPSRVGPRGPMPSASAFT